MDEESFTKLFPVRVISLTLTVVFTVLLYAFSAFAGENNEHQPSNEKVEKKEEGIPNPAPDKATDVVISPALGKKAEPFHPIILRAAKHHEMDPALIKAIIMVESRYNPNAISKHGAKGLMQLMPRTARALGVEDTFDAEQNVNGGVKYLKQLLDEFNDNLKFALAAYNAGSSKVRRYRGIPPIKATQNYVKKVFAYYQYYKNEPIAKTDSA
jgi:soluble lytic murein transglycosylase-like protein